MSTLSELLKRIEMAAGPDWDLDATICIALQYVSPFAPGATNVKLDEVEPDWLLYEYEGTECTDCIPSLTASLDAVVDLVQQILPDFWVTSGLCALSGHASIGPDYNGPNGDRLRKEWPEDRFHSGFDADLAPGDGRHRQCLAILHCAIQVLIAKEGAGQ